MTNGGEIFWVQRLSKAFPTRGPGVSVIKEAPNGLAIGGLKYQPGISNPEICYLKFYSVGNPEHPYATRLAEVSFAIKPAVSAASGGT